VLLATDPRRGEFPFSMALGGFMQLRWLEFARDATQRTDTARRSAGDRHPLAVTAATNLALGEFGEGLCRP